MKLFAKSLATGTLLALLSTKPMFAMQPAASPLSTHLTDMDTVSTSYKHLVTKITIDAPADVVWAILVDLDKYAEWNPLIISSKGKVEVGQHITNVMQPEGQKQSTFKPKVLLATPNQRFAWIGKVAFGGIFDGEHHFELKEVSPGKTLLVQHEYFSGLLVPFFKKMLKENTKHSFEALNLALKNRAEKQYLSRQASK
jgi:hypothetical protein